MFDTHRRYQYARELLLCAGAAVLDLVESMTLAARGLRPSLHAAARRSETLPVSLTAF